MHWKAVWKVVWPESFPNTRILSFKVFTSRQRLGGSQRALQSLRLTHSPLTFVKDDASARSCLYEERLREDDETFRSLPSISGCDPSVLKEWCPLWSCSIWWIEIFALMSYSLIILSQDAEARNWQSGEKTAAVTKFISQTRPLLFLAARQPYISRREKLHLFDDSASEIFLEFKI